MNPSGNPIPTCGGALRYSISAVLIVLLLGLLPAACSGPEKRAVSQGEHSSKTPGSGAPERPENHRPPDV